MSKIKKFILENIGLCTGLSACVVCLLFFAACQITVKSINDPQKRISIAELQSEVDCFNNALENRLQDINDQLLWRRLIFESAQNVIRTGTFDWLSVLTGAGSIVGVGAVADNIRYRIKRRKS